MSLPGTIRSFLEETNAPYEVLNHHRTTTLGQAAQACELTLNELTRTVVLADEQGLLMAIMSAEDLLDFDALGKQFNRDLELVPQERLGEIFDDCERGSCPPLAKIYGLEAVIDSKLKERKKIIFEPGSHTALIRMSGSDFSDLFDKTTYASITRELALLHPSDMDSSSREMTALMPKPLLQSMNAFHELPPVPVTTTQLLKLSADPLASAGQLADVVKLDPVLATQILRYANSAMYGYAGKIKDLQSAIARVLGFDFVLNLALALSVCKALPIPPDGPYGLNAFWKQAVYSGRLIEMLTHLIPGKKRPYRGTAYLAGLLQNIGWLALGNAFHPEFFILNKMAEANPDIPAKDLEKNVLGVTHDQIGAWLMEAWGMPEELTVAIQHHHNEGYWDQHAIYPQLTLIASRLLATYGIGSSDNIELPLFSLELLGLEETKARLATEDLLTKSQDLDALATMLSDHG
ncbi:MAG: HDOD domain-containing protein [Gammaproteobacteria bacterium]